MHRASARRARATSWLSRIRVLRNTVSSTILRLQLAGVRLTQVHTLVRQQVDVEGSGRELHGVQFFEPVPNLGLKLDGTPVYTIDAIYTACRPLLRERP